MTDIKVQTIEKNFDHILQKVGNDPYVNWEKFTHSSSAVINSIDELNKKMIVFRECQHRFFIQTMKKLKSLDLPELILAVKSKKLPRQALRGVIPRFKQGQGEKIQLSQSTESLKQHAVKQFQDYVKKNQAFVQQLKKYQGFIQSRIKDFGFVTQEPVEPQIKATVKFNLSEQSAAKIADQIKTQYIPGTSYISLKTYSQIVGSSFDLIKDENVRISKQARIKQRAIKEDSAKYLATLNQYLLNSEALIIDGQKLLSKKLGLSEGKLEQSEILMMERGLSNHLLALQSQLRSKVKQSIPPTKQVSFQQAKQIILFQTKMITEKQDYIKKVFEGLEKTQESVQTIPMLLALILNDMVYDKYGVQQQDFMKNVSEQLISTNPELMKIFKDMQIAIIKIMQYIGIIPQQVGKYMESNVHQRDLPQQQQVPGMVPGMMPGMSNPMQMLQMQQMQQMQQMFMAQQQQQKQ